MTNLGDPQSSGVVWDDAAAPAVDTSQDTSQQPAQDTSQPEDTSGVTWDNDQYNTPEQQVKAGLEGAAQGFLSKPLAIAAETHILGVKPEDIAGREEAYPITHGLSTAGGLIGGLYTEAGPAARLLGVAGKLAGGVSEAANIGKFGTAIIKGAIENGVFQGTDEIGNAMLGKGDPEAPVAAALSHMGAAALLGAGVGAAGNIAGKGLQAIADRVAGGKLSTFVEDFGNRWKWNQENPDLASAVTKELTDFHGSTSAAATDVYGPTNLKGAAIEKLVPPMNDSIKGQNQEIASNLQDQISEMMKDPDTYPAQYTKKVMAGAQKWSEIANDPNASSNDIFDATQELKQRLHYYANFDKQTSPFAPERGFIDVAKDLSHYLRTSLEDTSVWGDAGTLQKGINGAYSDFKKPLEDFTSKFTTKVEGIPEIDPGKVNTYVNQLGDPKAEIKQGMLSNYVDAATKFRNQINNIHAKLGVDSPLVPSSLDAVKGTLDKALSPGARAADSAFKVGSQKVGEKISGNIAGADVGYRMGGIPGAMAGWAMGHLAPAIGNYLGRKVVNYGVPAILKIAGSDASNGILESLDHADNVSSGARKISQGVSSLFKAPAQQGESYVASDKDREKLKKFIANGTFSKQVQSELNQTNPNPSAPSAPTQSYAQGGAVETPLGSRQQTQSSPTPPLMNAQTNALSTHFPDQNILMQAARSRVNNYLNSVRPQQQGKLPFDTTSSNATADRTYNRALDMANEPLSVLHHIKDGSLTPEHVKHLVSMYPEIHNQLSKKITERLSKVQLDGEKPSYKVRQGMSLLMGAPMDSTFTPGGIQTAQAVFMNTSSQQQQSSAPPVTKSKKDTSKLGELPKQYMTQDQARQQNKQTNSKD